jgi:hypothetical protein
MMEAATVGNSYLVDELLKRGADINKTNDIGNTAVCNSL